MTTHRTLGSGLGILFGTFACGAGWAQAHEDVLRSLAPQDREAYVKYIVARQQAERRSAAVAATDTAGPVLTEFKAGTKLDLGKSAAPYKINFKATDNMSGVASLNFYATGPSGQSIYAYGNPGYPATTFSGYGGFGSAIGRMLEPGTWHFSYGYAYDAAGNYSYFSEADLAALGNTTFTVVNNSGHDVAKPTLTGGKVQSAVVSLSGHPAGSTTKDPYVGVKLDVADTGSTVLAGVQNVYAYFCQLADASKCIYAYGYLYATSVASATISATTQVSAARGHVPGVYELRYVYVYDHAGNYSYYQSNLFSGTTDFSTMFPSTTIKLKP